jgi:hypothetical protein
MTGKSTMAFACTSRYGLYIADLTVLAFMRSSDGFHYRHSMLCRYCNMIVGDEWWRRVPVNSHEDVLRMSLRAKVVSATWPFADKLAVAAQCLRRIALEYTDCGCVWESSIVSALTLIREQSPIATVDCAATDTAADVTTPR